MNEEHDTSADNAHDDVRTVGHTHASIDGIQEIGTPEQLAKLYCALAKAQGAFRPVERSATGQQGHRHFRYATLADIDDATRAALAEHGLACTQPPTRRLQGVSQVVTMLTHEDGGRLISVLEQVGASDIRDHGASITYLRRYAKGAVLGVAGDPDLDDPNAPRDEATSRPQREQTPPTPAKAAKKTAPKPKEEPKPETASEPASEPAKSQEPVEPTDGPPTQAQREAVAELTRSLKYTRTRAMQMCREVTGSDPGNLSSSDMDEIIAHLRKEAGNAEST